MQLRVADFFANFDKTSGQVAETLVLGDLTLRLLYCRRRNDFGDRFSFHFSGQRVTWAVARGIRLGAMTRWFTALAKAVNQGSGPEIVQFGEGKFQPGSFALKISNGIGQSIFLSDSYIRCQNTTSGLVCRKILILVSCTRMHMCS
jgi:hypothetical protein